MKAPDLANNTLFNSSFAFECEQNFTLYGNSSYFDQTVRCTSDGTWDFGGLRCIGETSAQWRIRAGGGGGVFRGVRGASY